MIVKNTCFLELQFGQFLKLDSENSTYLLTTLITVFKTKVLDALKKCYPCLRETYLLPTKNICLIGEKKYSHFMGKIFICLPPFN